MRRLQRLLPLLFALFALLLASGCSLWESEQDTVGYQGGRYKGTKSYTVRGKTYHPYKTAQGYRETGIASWYGPGFHGKTTSNGERYNQNAMTAAHKLLPFGTRLHVTNLNNGRTVEVRINDRGPFVGSRIIDLSKAAAQKLNMIGSGTAKVRLVALEDGKAPALLTPEGDMLGLFYVQIAAFQEYARAQSLADFMRAKGYGCRISGHGTSKHYFVQLGPYLSKSAADKAGRPLLPHFRTLFVVAE